MDSAELIKELMTAYDAKRSEWVGQLGNAEGFDEWFTRQVMG